MAAVRNLGRRFLLWCANEHNDFRVSEITSLATLFKIDLKWVEQNAIKPYIVIDVPSEDDVKKIMSRTLVVRSAYELWARAANHQDLHDGLRALPHDFIKPYCRPDCSFCIRVETFCKTLTTKEKLMKIEEFDFLPLEGPVKLVNPDACLTLLEFYGVNPNSVPDLPHDVFFGRWICNGQRDKISMLHLKKRKFIGNTSMDAQLSLIMANQALVEPGSLVYDPFVGTGGLLVSAAFFGAYVWGVDIDYLMLHGQVYAPLFTLAALLTSVKIIMGSPEDDTMGSDLASDGGFEKWRASINPVIQAKGKWREPDESIATNLSQYMLKSQYMDAIVGDSSKPFWREEFLFDAIITDPPYGIRESTERVGTTRSYQIREHIQQHIPSKIKYSMQDLYKDLLNFSARHLKISGRLVYWLPVYLEDYSDESVPKHPCLELVSNCEQPLAAHTSRRLITMMKTREPTQDECMEAKVSDKTSHFSKQFFKAALRNRLAKQKFTEANQRVG